MTTTKGEGHGLRFDSHGSLVGLTIVHPARLLGQGRPLTITIPTPVEVERSAVAAAMAATAACVTECARHVTLC
jgi:hypothetical protein